MSICKELIYAARQAGGSHKTVANRCAVVRRFADFLRMENIQIRHISNIKLIHLENYIRAGLERDLGARTLQSEASALRTTLRIANRGKLASSLCNRKLRIAGASRKGTKMAMPDAKYTEIFDAVMKLDEGVAACIELQVTIGLRQKEAIMASKSLMSWRKALIAEKPLRVLFGTKGGRPRDVALANGARALRAVQAAIALADKQNNNIIDKSNLKSAMQRYTRIMHKAGAIGKYSGHSLRYRFAIDQIEHYLRSGYSLDESLALTANDLGHGDGRGRWVMHVYDWQRFSDI